jgi:DNA-binding MarR family transcriptional regulator
MREKNELVLELQTVLGQLRRSVSFGHSRLHLKGAEKQALFMIAKLNEGKPVSPTEIAAKTGVTMPAVTHQINSLEEEGLVKRIHSKEDRRSVLISLSGDGEKKLRKIKAEFSQKLEALSDFLGEKDTRELIRIIRKISQYPDFLKEKTND